MAVWRHSAPERALGYVDTIKTPQNASMTTLGPLYLRILSTAVITPPEAEAGAPPRTRRHAYFSALSQNSRPCQPKIAGRPLL